MNQVDWQAIAPEIALQLLGEPNFCKKATEWRWGNHGSMVFQPDKATFYDHEEGDGGGVVGSEGKGDDKDEGECDGGEEDDCEEDDWDGEGIVGMSGISTSTNNVFLG